MVFKKCNGEEDLKTGAYGILEPKKTCPIVSPNLSITPLVAFDRS